MSAAENPTEPGATPDDATGGFTQPGTAPVDAAFAARASSGGPALLDERPEVAVGAALAGGFVLALILKRLAS